MNTTETNSTTACTTRKSRAAIDWIASWPMPDQAKTVYAYLTTSDGAK